MTPHRFALSFFIAAILWTAAAGAVTLTTSARVQIVPGVDIERIAPSRSVQEELGIEDAASPEGALVFRIAGPPHQAVNIGWTTTTSAETSPAAPARTTPGHDDDGEFRVWLEEGATDGHLLIVFE